MKRQLSSALQASARVAAAAGAIELAHDEACQALAIASGTESRLDIVDLLECLGALARDAEGRHKAVRLLGAAGAIRHNTGYRRYQMHQTRYDAAVAELCAALGDAAFAQAWDEGAALTCDDVVKYALRGRGERGPSVSRLAVPHTR